MAGEPIRIVIAWLAAAFEEGALADAWPLTDEPLRLALVQSWVLVNEELVDLSIEERNQLTTALARPTQPSHNLWPTFAEWRVRRWRAILPAFVVDPTRRGFVSIPQAIGVDLEAVMIAEARTGEPRTFAAQEAVEVQRLLVRHTADGVRLAGIGGVLPVPGWPPSETEPLPL
jgi:hypothetical protein